MRSSGERLSCGWFYLRLNYSSLILLIVRLGRPPQKGVKKNNNNNLPWQKGTLGKGAGAQAPSAPPPPPLHVPAAQTSTSQIRFNLSHKERWLTRRVRWQTRRWQKSFKTKCKAPVLSLLTSESDINLSQGCQSTLQMRNSPRSTKWKVNKW